MRTLLIMTLDKRFEAAVLSGKISNCSACLKIMNSGMDTCPRCGAQVFIQTAFPFRERIISWYSILVPPGQFRNVVEQLRDDYEERTSEFGQRNANIALVYNVLADVRARMESRLKKLLIGAAGFAGLGGLFVWILGEDE
ncbi:MAG: hypothetical protein AAGA21_16095 [Pseudomonadota bacterium]